MGMGYIGSRNSSGITNHLEHSSRPSIAVKHSSRPSMEAKHSYKSSSIDCGYYIITHASVISCHKDVDNTIVVQY